MKLITMTAFVMARSKDLDIQFDRNWDQARVNGEINFYQAKFNGQVIDYAKFLSTKLTLEMFVHPSQTKDLPGAKPWPGNEGTALFPEMEDKVLFKDLSIEYVDVSKKYYIKKSNGFFVISGPKSMFGNNLTIEDLVHRDLELTDRAVKLIFG